MRIMNHDDDDDDEEEEHEDEDEEEEEEEEEENDENEDEDEEEEDDDDDEDDEDEDEDDDDDDDDDDEMKTRMRMRTRGNRTCDPIKDWCNPLWKNTECCTNFVSFSLFRSVIADVILTDELVCFRQWFPQLSWFEVGWMDSIVETQPSLCYKWSQLISS